MDCSSDMRRDSGRRAAEKRALWRKLARVSNSEVELLNASKKDANIARYWALKFATIRPPALLSHSVPRRQETKRRADTRVRRARRCTSGSSCIYTMGSENFHRSAEKISRKNVQRGNSDVAPFASPPQAWRISYKRKRWKYSLDSTAQWCMRHSDGRRETMESALSGGSDTRGVTAIRRISGCRG